MSKEFKFKIGADPEFNLELYNKRLDAKQTITNLLKNNKNFESVTEGFKVKDKKSGILGWDGHSSTGEIRPSAENEPSKIVENIGEIYREFSKAGPLFEISTLCRNATVGGHIHFELPEGGEANPERIKAIHKRMMSLYLPIIMGENKTNLAMRIKGGYGALCTGSPYRVESHFTRPNGSRGFTYELRCPSAEWTVTPKIATATLSYLGVIYHEIMKHPKKFEETCKDIIIRTEKQGNAIQELALAEYEPITRAIFNKIKKYVKTFELYEDFKEEIDYILRPHQVLADKQAANFDIKLGWKLVKEAKESPRKVILSEKAFKKRIKEKDLDTMTMLVNVAYNEDSNVDAFAQRLTQTVAAFNWKLSKQYFLYGVRKGINGYVIGNSTKATLIGTDQIKTVKDSEAIDKLVEKMRTKARNILGPEGITKRINFKTGKQEQIKKEIITIGIPYEERIEGKTNKLIELIYDIEKGKIKQPKRNNKNLIDDSALPEEEMGKIYKTLNKIEPEMETLLAGVPGNIEDEVNNNERLETIQREIEDIERETQDMINTEITPGEVIPVGLDATIDRIIEENPFN